VTVVCPSGHRSETADYCDQCGLPIATDRAAVAGPPSLGTVALPPEEDVDTSAAAPREPCPACGAPRSGDDRYCEGCGHDFVAPAGARWEAIVAADRRQFERFAVAGLAFPDDYPPRRFAVAGAQVRIGRSRGRPGESPPEIDLAGTPADPGISRLHAVLERRPDGGYGVRDLGSTNGTTVNDDPSPIGTEAAVPVGPGDRIRLGAWTTITLRLASEVVPGEDP
jgi:hypothetical protein